VGSEDVHPCSSVDTLSSHAEQKAPKSYKGSKWNSKI
jgi:hypothetical protein